jgi:hypothetical protein
VRGPSGRSDGAQKVRFWARLAFANYTSSRR